MPEEKISTPSPYDYARIENSGIPSNNSTNPGGVGVPSRPQQEVPYQELSYREHVSAPHYNMAYPPPTPPSAAPYQPAYPPSYPAYGGNQQPVTYNGQAQPYQAYPGYGGYPGYYSYPHYGYPYAWQPPQPKRDGYLLAISITAFIGSILALLGGLLSLLLLLLFNIGASTSSVQQGQLFGGIVLFVSLATVGLAGGSFGLYHSIRSLFLRKPSAQFKLPWFWIFLVLYLGVIAVGIVLHVNDQAVSNVSVTIILIALAGLFPALAILSLGVRRLHYPRNTQWPTTWRRFTMALVSGGTSAIVFAMILEFILQFVVVVGLHLTPNIANLNGPLPHSPVQVIAMFILLSVIAPIVEETVKPLAVVALIGRLRNAQEAFVLGLACGIGFDLIETSSYIGMGYKDWLTVAIERSSAGLLHGFGAGMVALGWYLLTHKNAAPHRILLGLGCGVYAVLQHAIWNGSFLLALLPAPLGPYLENGTVNVPLGPLSFSFESMLLIYMVLTILMLVFFFYVTGKLRGKKDKPQPAAKGSEVMFAPTPQMPVA